MNKVLLSVVFIAAVIFQSDSLARSMGGKPLETVIATEKQLNSSVQPVEASQELDAASEKILKATAKIKKIKMDAETAIVAIRANLAKGEITPVEAAKKIGEQNYKVKKAENKLAQLTKESIEKLEEEGYLSQLISPLKSGYGYTREQKDSARAIITELEKQKKDVMDQFENTKNQVEQITYAQMIKDLEDEIYNQQLITGDVMSTSRKLFWGAVAVAGTVAGVALGKYLTNSQKAKDVDALGQWYKQIEQNPEEQNGEKPGWFSNWFPRSKPANQLDSISIQVQTETPAPTPESPAPTPESPAPTPESPAPTPESPAPTPATPAPTPESPAQTPEAVPAPESLTLDQRVQEKWDQAKKAGTWIGAKAKNLYDRMTTPAATEALTLQEQTAAVPMPAPESASEELTPESESLTLWGQAKKAGTWIGTKGRDFYDRMTTPSEQNDQPIKSTPAVKPITMTPAQKKLLENFKKK